MNIKLDWLSYCPAPFDDPLYHLSVQQSLTQALQSTGLNFSVRLHHLGHTDTVPPYFTDMLIGKATWFTREVFLYLDNIPVVSAQSLCSPHSSWRKILDCGNRSLGETLFADTTHWTRSPIQFSIPNQSNCLLARRSWFTHTDDTILYLSECFLPTLNTFMATFDPNTL